jgi:energy-converting hydrogenase Eha subunit B
MAAKPQEIIESRPAETGGFAAAMAVLICYLLGVDDPGLLAALTVVVGTLPGIITWIVVQSRKG